MLTHPTHNRLVTLGLTGMAKALEEQRNQPDIAALDFEERLAILVDCETTERENKRLVSRLRFAGLRQNAVVEDIDLKATRGLDKALFHKLVAGDWIDRHHNLLIIGPTGVGKSWIACALGHKACRDDRSVLYQRLPRLLDALTIEELVPRSWDSGRSPGATSRRRRSPLPSRRLPACGYSTSQGGR
jgi:DNA replication protein DnaC